MKNKNFPLDFEYRKEDGVLAIYLNDSTILIDLESYKKIQKEYLKEVK